MIQFIIESQIVWFTLFVIYFFLLRKQPYFRTNRFILLSTVILGIALPLIQFDFNIVNPIMETQTFLLDQLTISSQGSTITNLENASYLNLLSIVFILGLIFSVARFGYGFFILKSIQKSSIRDHHVSNLYNTSIEHAPFSFFNKIYIYNKEDYTPNQLIALLNHENVHVEERHSYDNIIIELTKLFFWWSPLVYLIQKELKDQHEFIADYQAIHQSPKGSYIELLSKLIYKNKPKVLVNHFQTNIKKRLIMLTKSNNQNQNWTKYLLIIPVFSLLFMYTSCTSEKPNPEEEIVQKIEDVYKVVETMPTFPGCEGEANEKECAQKKMLQFIYTNIKYPQTARDNGIEGTVVIKFVVEQDGAITKSTIVRDPGGTLGKEALRVVNEMPRWNPGKQNGEVVAVEYNLPVKFKLQ